MEKKLTEAISLKLRKSFMVSRTKTFLIVAILVVGFIALNLWIDSIELPKFDITEEKLFSLSDKSKKEIKKIDKDVNVVVFGYDKDSTVVNFLKQYNECNPLIKYEIITNEDNPDRVNQYGFEAGSQNVVVEVGDSNKTLSSYDFVSYDYTTYQQIDLTENALTNAMLSLTVAKKPKVYIVTGHDELSTEQYLTKILKYLEDEVFEYTTLNLLTTEAIPDDCDLIAVISPRKDLIENEVTVLQNYINNGGNIIFTSDLLKNEEANMPNWQRILDLYGLTIENGIVYETDSNSYVANSPLILFPKVQSSSITSTIASDGAMILELPKRIITADEAKQTELNVTYEELLKSSDKSFFITDFNNNNDIVSSIENQEPQSSIIAVKATKTLGTPNTSEEASNESNENSENEEKTSQIIVIANGSFISNVESLVAAGYTQVDLYNNADFFLNSVADLTEREELSIRKETNSSTYAPTQKEDIIILIIIFVVPILIIIIGIVVWNHRRHKR